jgi:hypothetical protein
MGQRLVQWIAIGVVTLVAIAAAIIGWRELTRPVDQPPIVCNEFDPRALAKAPAGAAADPAAGQAPAERLPAVKVHTWPELEAQFQELREKRKSDPLATHELSELYDTVSELSFTQAANYPQHIAQLQKWQEELPTSPTPLVVLGSVYLHYAWDARGSGVAATVSEVGWTLFHDRIDQAQEVLEQAIALGPKDGAAYAALMTVAKAKGTPRSQARAWLDSGRKLDPTYSPMYLGMLDALQPKWGGSPGEAEKFAAEIADQVGGDDGLEVFGILAHAQLRENPGALYWSELDRDKATRAADVLLARYAKSQFAIQFAAIVAWANHDVDKARVLLPQIAQPDERIWGHARFPRFAKWCELDQPMPGEKSRMWASLFQINSLAFAPNSRYLWYEARPSAFPVRLIDTQTGQARQRMRAPTTPVSKFDFSPSQRLLAGLTSNQEYRGVAVWKVTAGDEEEPLAIPTEGECMSTAVCPTAPLVAVHDANSVRLVDAQTGETMREIATLHDRIGTMFFSRDGKLLLTVGGDEAAVWDVDSGEKRYAIRLNDTSPGATSVLRALQFDGESRLVCLGLVPPGVHGILRFADGGATHETLLKARLEYRCCISLDSKFIASRAPPDPDPAKPKAMEIWSTETRSVIQSLPGHAGEITALAFSLDGKLLASATEFGEIKVWEIQPQQP